MAKRKLVLRVGQKVYHVDKDTGCIVKETVFALGKSIIIPEGFRDYKYDYQVLYVKDIYTNFEDAKKAARKIIKEYCERHKVKPSQYCLKETVRDQWEYVGKDTLE